MHERVVSTFSVANDPNRKSDWPELVVRGSVPGMVTGQKRAMASRASRVLL